MLWTPHDDPNPGALPVCLVVPRYKASVMGSVTYDFAISRGLRFIEETLQDLTVQEFKRARLYPELRWLGERWREKESCKEPAPPDNYFTTLMKYDNYKDVS